MIPLAMTKLGGENSENQAQGYDVPNEYGKRMDQDAVDDPERSACGKRGDAE